MCQRNPSRISPDGSPQSNTIVSAFCDGNGKGNISNSNVGNRTDGGGTAVAIGGAGVEGGGSEGGGNGGGGDEIGTVLEEPMDAAILVWFFLCRNPPDSSFFRSCGVLFTGNMIPVP